MDADRSPLLLTNLLNDLETLCGLLVERVAIGDELNSYLLAAGAQQIVEDYLHRDPLSLSRGAARLERLEPGRRGHIAAAIPRIAGHPNRRRPKRAAPKNGRSVKRPKRRDLPRRSRLTPPRSWRPR